MRAACARLLRGRGSDPVLSLIPRPPDNPLSARVKRKAEQLLPPSVRARKEQERRQEERRELERQRLERIAQRRRELFERDPAVRTFIKGDDEFLGRVVDDFTAAGTAAHNLRLVTDALRAADVDYFLVPGRDPFRYVVGVHRSERKQFLESMRELYRESAVYAAKPGKETAAEASAYVDGALSKEVKSALTIRFTEHLLGPDGRYLAGPDLGCDVEFWRDGAALMDTLSSQGPAKVKVDAPDDVLSTSLVAPRRNRVADVLPADQRQTASLTVQGREYPTYTPFTWPLVEDIDFPIDAVYTWVDGDDPDHAAKRARYRGAPLDGKAVNASRFTSRDELRYSLRSLRTYAPFIRHVYIVTDGQVPPWLDTAAEGITVVDHRDIFTDPDALPTFNSHAIGTQLHHIEGLSERYLYLNDDVFFARPVNAQTFFHANGIACLPFSPHQFGTGKPHPEEVAPNSAGKNVRALLYESFGRRITHKFKHVPHPQIRGVFRELEERYADAIDRTARSRFRDPTDVGVAATLHHHYALLTGRGVAADYRMRYIDIADQDAAERIARMEHERETDFFCLNELDTPPEREEEITRMVREFLTSRFPFPSRFEKAD